MGKWDPVESCFNGVIANRVFGKPMIGCHILQCTGSLKFDLILRSIVIWSLPKH